MIWSAKVPSNIKFCLWKACRDVLPMRSRLQTKGVVVPLTCNLCDRDVENCCHVVMCLLLARLQDSVRWQQICWIRLTSLLELVNALMIGFFS